MQNLGYESHNSLLILGSLWIFVAIYIAQVLTVLIYKALKFVLKNKISSKRMDKLSDIVFFQAILGLIIEGYFEFLISGYMNMVSRADTLEALDGEVIGKFVSMVSIAISLGVFPIVLVYLHV